MQVIRTHDAKIGQHRNNPRVWIEGKYLAAAGEVERSALGLINDLAAWDKGEIDNHRLAELIRYEARNLEALAAIIDD